MDEKEFSEKLRKHRKTKRKKVKSDIFQALPILIGMLLIFIAIFSSFATPTHNVSGTIRHKSSSSPEHLLFQPSSNMMFLSSDPEVSWSAYYADTMMSPASVEFMIIDQVNSDTLIHITTTSYEEKLSNIDCPFVEYYWINNDESQDIKVYCSVKYHANMFWVSVLMMLGIILNAYALISMRATSKHERNLKKEFHRSIANEVSGDRWLEKQQ